VGIKEKRTNGPQTRPASVQEKRESSSASWTGFSEKEEKVGITEWTAC